MKILYVTTVGSTMSFFYSFITELVQKGHTVEIATNQQIKPLPEDYKKLGCKTYEISCQRTPFSLGTIKAIREITKIVSENDYDIVHCHTPIASLCARLACKKIRGTVIYTAHGFHFYKGAPLKNWLLYYPIEKVCARYTDILITINQEDFELAKKKMKGVQVEYVPGVGIDTDKFKNTAIDRAKKRQELDIPEDAFLMISVGELNANKNHEVILKAMAQLADKNIHYMIAGKGSLENYLLDLASELGIEKQVHLLGFRRDVAELYKAADVCCFPSIREGLGLSAIEALTSGIPVVAADNRGTREYIVDGKNGYLCSYDCAEMFSQKISLIKSEKAVVDESHQRFIKKFDYKEVNKRMHEIYSQI